MNNNKIYAYARVSTKEQNLDRQMEVLIPYVENERDIITDKASGKDFNREGYTLLKEKLLRSGDTLVIKELDRLGRDMDMIKEEWNSLIKMGVNIIVIDTPILNTTNKSDLEKNLISNIVFELLTYMAEKERQKIRSRQAEGIKAMPINKEGKKYSKKSGMATGRPKIESDNFIEIYSLWKNGEITAVKAMELTNLTKATFYRKVKEYESN